MGRRKCECDVLCNCVPKRGEGASIFDPIFLYIPDEAEDPPEPPFDSPNDPCTPYSPPPGGMPAYYSCGTLKGMVDTLFNPIPQPPGTWYYWWNAGRSYFYSCETEQYGDIEINIRQRCEDSESGCEKCNVSVQIAVFRENVLVMEWLYKTEGPMDLSAGDFEVPYFSSSGSFCDSSIYPDSLFLREP